MYILTIAGTSVVKYTKTTGGTGVSWHPRRERSKDHTYQCDEISVPTTPNRRVPTGPISSQFLQLFYNIGAIYGTYVHYGKYVHW